MKTTMICVALAGAMAFAGSASAALYCKNDKGHVLEWHTDWSTPIIKNGRDANKDLADFDVSAARDVVCFVNGALLKTHLPSIQGIPYIGGIETSGPHGPGLIYRGDYAKFLVENLTAVTHLPATKADYDESKP